MKNSSIKQERLADEKIAGNGQGPLRTFFFRSNHSYISSSWMWFPDSHLSSECGPVCLYLEQETSHVLAWVQERETGISLILDTLVSEEVINTILKDESKVTGKRSVLAEGMFSLRLTFPIHFWPQPFLPGEIPAISYSAMSQDPCRKQKALFSNGVIQEEKWIKGVIMTVWAEWGHPSRNGKASWSESEGAVWGVVLKARNLLGSLRLSQVHRVKTISTIMPRQFFAFFSLILSRVHNGVF